MWYIPLPGKFMEMILKEIPLSQGYVALVDDEDYDELNQYKWHVNTVSRGSIYAQRTIRPPGGRQTTIFMHRQMNPTWAGQVDHIDGNGLDNRRANQREATHAENSRNRRSGHGSTSKYLGVAWSKSHRKWRATVAIDGANKHLGSFSDEKDAARAYDKAAYERDPEFCRLNFPEDYA